MPSPLLRAKVLAGAAELAYQIDADLAGALRNAESALQQMPLHLDSLFVKANCLHSLSGVMDDDDDTDEDPSKVTQQFLSETAMQDVHKHAHAASRAFHHYFEVTVPEHAHKPAAHFNYALLLLSACDLQYSVHCRDADVSQQSGTAAAKAAATARGIAGAASNPDLYKALLVLKQTLEEFNPHVEAAYKAGLAAQAEVPKWFTVVIAPGVNTPRCVKEILEQRQRTVVRIKALEQERGGVTGTQAAAGSNSSSSGAAAAGAFWHGAASTSSSSTVNAAVSGAVGSGSAAPSATDDQLQAALLQLVAASDITVVSYKQLHQQLEAMFQMDLSHKRSFLKQVLLDSIPADPQTQPPAAPSKQSGSSSRRSGPASAPAAAAAAGDDDAAESSSCCKVCKAQPQTLMRCSHCKAVKYCSATCQAQDWKAHKAVCAKKA